MCTFVAPIKLATIYEVCWTREEEARRIEALRRDCGTSHLVMFRCMDPRSVHYGAVTLIATGPGHAVKSPQEYAGRILTHEETGAGVQGLVGAAYIEPFGFEEQAPDDGSCIGRMRAWYRHTWILLNGSAPSPQW